jgi:signal transduction histidine kinase
MSQVILTHTRSGMSRVQLLCELSRVLIEASEGTAVEWWLKEGRGYFRCSVMRDDTGEVRWEVDNIDVKHPEAGIIAGTKDEQGLDRIYLDIVEGQHDPGASCFTPQGSFWIPDTRQEVVYESATTGEPRRYRLEPSKHGRSLVLVPLRGADHSIGFVELKSARVGRFSREEVEFYEVVAETMSMALVHQHAQASLGERVKELSCLYEVLRIADRLDSSLSEVLQDIANLLPPAWQYPDKTAARVTLDGNTYSTSGFVETSYMQSADVVIRGEKRGSIDVVYLEARPHVYEGPFLKEERHLIDALARELSGIIERRRARADRARLEDQIRHADRLATIGQLAAGVAHELNEPLGNILGFAELANKAEGIPESARQDLQKIVNACLYSRKVVSKLKLFARQAPAHKVETDLNKMVREELFFIESRCATQGIEIVQDLDPDLPRVNADSSQMYQVLVNLTVNAVQAMPNGGLLTIETRGVGDGVVLIVEDTGAGMSEETQANIFMPFFTTKDVDQGTGLGLSVVDGIVTAHGGTTTVSSVLGEGSRFEVRIPRSDPRDKVRE